MLLGFGGELFLSDKGTTENVVRGNLRGIQVEGCAGDVFGFRIALEEKKSGAEIVQWFGRMRLTGGGHLKL